MFAISGAIWCFHICRLRIGFISSEGRRGKGGRGSRVRELRFMASTQGLLREEVRAFPGYGRDKDKGGKGSNEAFREGKGKGTKGGGVKGKGSGKAIFPNSHRMLSPSLQPMRRHKLILLGC